MKLRTLLLSSLLAVPWAPASLSLAQTLWAPGSLVPYSAVGSWFGKADQVCASAATCDNIALFMTPTLTEDLEFIGNDSLTLGGAPFGPHTTAHGRWISTGQNSIIADYVFMLPGTASPPTLTVLRFRWQATVTDYDTMTGYVNIYFGAPVPVVYDSNLTASEYPTIPDEATFAITPPTNFYTDPTVCTSGPPACPLIFKFTIKRVQP